MTLGDASLYSNIISCKLVKRPMLEIEVSYFNFRLRTNGESLHTVLGWLGLEEEPPLPRKEEFGYQMHSERNDEVSVMVVCVHEVCKLC